MTFYTEAIGAGLTVYDHRKTIKKLLTRLLNRITKGKVRIVIFGPGGVGKSTLGNLLSTEYKAVQPNSYIESVEIEKYDKSGDIPCDLIVGPGQERRRVETWDDLFRGLAKDGSKGIINIVDYGYNSFAKFGYKELKNYKEGMTKSEFLQVYTEFNQGEEITILREISPYIISADSNLWMITLVTKQDLWWEKRTEVEKHYTNGQYNDLIEELKKHRGEANFRHEYVSASLVMTNLVSGTSEMLAKTTGGYDQNLQNSNLETLLNTIDSLVARKKNK